jgi:hypothetical protein
LPSKPNYLSDAALRKASSREAEMDRHLHGSWQRLFIAKQIPSAACLRRSRSRTRYKPGPSGSREGQYGHIDCRDNQNMVSIVHVDPAGTQNDRDASCGLENRNGNLENNCFCAERVLGHITHRLSGQNPHHWPVACANPYVDKCRVKVSRRPCKAQRLLYSNSLRIADRAHLLGCRSKRKPF